MGGKCLCLSHGSNSSTVSTPEEMKLHLQVSLTIALHCLSSPFFTEHLVPSSSASVAQAIHIGAILSSLYLSLGLFLPLSLSHTHTHTHTHTHKSNL
jgi:hypothetical protein